MQRCPTRMVCVVVHVAVLPAIFLSGCAAKEAAKAPAPPPPTIDFTSPLKEGDVALRKIPPEQYPDFAKALTSANAAELRESAKNSLVWFAKSSSAKKYPYLDIDHDRAAASVRAFIALIDSNAFGHNPKDFNARIAHEFEVYQSIGAPAPDGRGNTNKVLFTGYFTPTYNASLTREGAYQWPLYKRPKDLVTDLAGDTAGRKAADGSTAPYFTRRQIESGALAGNELVWLTSRWQAYVITVQGSARLRLPDGKIMEVGYAGYNGYPYPDLSPGKKMVADGLIAVDDLSLEAMRRYFDAHPDAMDRYLWLNPRTVFFHEVHGGPFGSLNVPVTRMASLATDKEVYPPGMLAFLTVPIPASDASLPRAGARSDFSGFAFDQDKGGAIRSAGRCDIYMGIGERAEQTAGHQLNPGQLYYLAVKPELVGKYSR